MVAAGTPVEMALWYAQVVHWLIGVGESRWQRYDMIGEVASVSAARACGYHQVFRGA